MSPRLPRDPIPLYRATPDPPAMPPVLRRAIRRLWWRIGWAIGATWLVSLLILYGTWALYHHH